MTSLATSAWNQIREEVEAELEQFAASVDAEEKQILLRCANLSTQIAMDKLAGLDTKVAEAGLVAAYLSIQSSATQGAALLAVKIARDTLRKVLSAGLTLLAGL